jgi:protein TonB
VDPAPVVVEQAGPMDLPALPPAETAPPLADRADTAPVAGVRLQYASAPPPPYPRRELADRIQGQVLLRVLVDVDGRPLEVAIHRSSGNRELDRTAQRHILRHWTFRPAMQDGRAVRAIGLVPIDFKLQ